ncbi:MAG: hypothetical protein J6I49_01735 [Bacteroidales bacterium]|nr:hypothetical protein [Bacteroidales bacterium]
MKKKYTFYLFLLALIAGLEATAQETAAGEDDWCIDRPDLLQMIHAPLSDPNNTTLIDMMDAKGFQLGSDVVHRIDTVSGIALSYRCQVWYANVSGQLMPAVYVGESEQGLPNVIILNLDYSRECTSQLTNAFHESGYMYDGRRNVYTGRDAYEKHSGLYEAEYIEDADGRRLAVRFESDIAAYVKKESDRRKALVENRLHRADELAKSHRYHLAFTTLDTLFGWYEPMDEHLYQARQDIERMQVAHYRAELKRAVNADGDLEAGIRWCDSLARVNAADDSIGLVRQVLVEQTQGRYPKYSTFMPQNYRSVVDRLNDIINKEIHDNRLPKAQSMNFEFNFITTHENRSNGSIQISMERSFLQSRSKEKSRNEELQTLVDNLAALDLIEPVSRYGITINTREQLSGRIEWQQSEVTLKGDELANRKDLKIYVDSIDNRYFTNSDPTAVGKNRMRLPYRRDYTFGITRKQYDGSLYTDVTLTKFKTSGPLAWMPSLLIPGLGTKKQGRISTVSARAIPFFLFAGMSAAGFVLKSQDYERTEWGDGPFWKHKNFDNALAFGGLAVSGTIYLTDLIESINATVVNRSRSKKLRQELRSHNIDVRIDEIQIH